MKASRVLLVVPALANLAATQESIDFFSVIASEAGSVYTQVNSILSSAASAASAAAASATASTTSDTTTTTNAPTLSASDPLTASDGTASTSVSPSELSSSTSTSDSSTTSGSSAVFGSINSSSPTPSTTSHTSSQTSSSDPTSLLTLSTPIVGTSSGFGAAAETATTLPSASRSSHGNNVAIILGCVLGALALGFFILALVICCKRRRHGSSPRHSALSGGDDEVEAWREPQPAGILPSRGSSRHARGVSGTAPLMAEHPAYRNAAPLENPFAPIPPRPRRAPPPPRAGLTDGTIPGDDPFANPIARPPSIRSQSSTSSSLPKSGIAAGIAAAAAGGALMHEQDKHELDGASLSNDKPVPEPAVGRRVSRKPVPVSRVDNKDWPYSPVSPIDPAAELAALTTTSPARNSDESHRSFGRDAARANTAFDQEYALPNDGSRSHSRDHSLEAAAAGLAAGAVGGAALPHRPTGQERHRSRSSSSSNSNNHNNSNRRSRPPLAIPGDDSDHSSSSKNFRESRNSRSGSYNDVFASQPQEMVNPEHGDLYGVPFTPGPRSRKNSGQGSPVPGAAAFNYANRPTIPSPLSSEVRPDSRAGQPPPRSKARRSTSGGSRYSFPYEPMEHDYGTYPVFSGPRAGTSHGNAGSSEAIPSLSTLPQQPHPTANPNPDRAIVGDNRYPHMNVPRRKSGGDYDISGESLGAQMAPQDTRPFSLGMSRNAAIKSWSGDDSSWRISDGMPSGWQRASIDSPRNSRDLGTRDSGVGMNAGKRRLRASDLAGRDDGPYAGLGRAL
ncbi:hypothetical protein A1O7_06120 [Cladophialophora yegresii CBS 114405]|uniref:Uncharacterized protein n=1 Tax=Cladophialophora yegresii CBS 114405 TaxID=1182544 RepID=W9W2E9_9EURO|nr:uncharacterized protein A1O7_06120 [Cladophialophora yegresii CBS 114405]EXJ58691.1 hypothetical protein A1O7_06120 [Cladophialophora yegresii CBS 114405]